MALKPVIPPGLVQGSPTRPVLAGGYTRFPFRPVLAGGIAQVGAGVAPFVGPLDAYTTDLKVAWSAARRLLSSYTGSLIRVRRSSDNTEQDFGYDASGDLDTASLLTFCGGGDGFLHTFYDQSGGGYHLVQATMSEQIRIVASGVADTLGSNSKPCGNCRTNLTGGYVSSTFTEYTGTNLTKVAVGLINNSQSGSVYIATTKDAGAANSTGGGSLSRNGTNESIRAVRGVTVPATAAMTYGAAKQAGVRYSGTTAFLQWGATTSSGATSLAFAINRVIIGGSASGTQLMGVDDKQAEGAVWLADIGDTAFQSILTEMGTYFGT